MFGNNIILLNNYISIKKNKRAERPEITFHLYGQMIAHKDSKDI